MFWKLVFKEFAERKKIPIKPKVQNINKIKVLMIFEIQKNMCQV
jgi:hypothetical protein